VSKRGELLCKRGSTKGHLAKLKVWKSLGALRVAFMICSFTDVVKIIMSANTPVFFVASKSQNRTTQLDKYHLLHGPEEMAHSNFPNGPDPQCSFPDRTAVRF
jgi:hypothetical protein